MAFADAGWRQAVRLDHSCKCNQSPQNITILYNWYHTHSDLLHLLFICEMRYGMKLHDAVEAAALAGHCRAAAWPTRWRRRRRPRAYSRAKPIHHKVWCVTTQWGEPLSLGLMSREKVKNHEYSFDIGSNPTETVIEMCVCVCIERLTIKFSERAKPLLYYEFYRVFFSQSVSMNILCLIKLKRMYILLTWVFMGNKWSHKQ